MKNNSPKKKITDSAYAKESSVVISTSFADTFSDEIKQEIMYKIINRKQRFKDNPKKYTGEDVLEAISLTAQKMQEITNQDITNFYKDKEINYADALLFKTARNNFKAGQETQKREMQKEIDEWRNRYYTGQKIFCEHNDRVNENLNEKVKKLKDDLYLKFTTGIICWEDINSFINKYFGGKE
jgi:hypothetical protein